MKRKGFLLFIFILINVWALGQNEKPERPLTDTTNITFRDTLFNFVFDSVSHNLGAIPDNDDELTLVKHFKYIGTEPIEITRAWTMDPHWICEYPRERLIPGKTYSYRVCFSHRVGGTFMPRHMGFIFSDGNRTSFYFTGEYVPEVKWDR